MFLEEVGKEFLTNQEMEMLENPKRPQAKKCISNYLNSSERDIIDSGIEDQLILALINKIKKESPERFSKFEYWHAKQGNLGEYIKGELEWVKKSEYFLKGNQKKLLDQTRESISPTYRAFFILKYSEKSYQDKKYPNEL